MTTVFKEKTEANIIEKSSGVVRTAMGLHLRSKIFDDLTRHPKFFEPACQIRGHNLYIQQTKINVKAAFTGEVWQWHYDFATHFGEDGVPKPLALNLHVFLDDVTEFNGPLFFIPKSHKYGSAPSKLDTVTTSYPLWTVDQQTVKNLVKENITQYPIYGINSTSTMLPFMKNSVNRIIALESAQHFNPFPDFISESERVLKEDGILTFAIPVTTKDVNLKNLGILFYQIISNSLQKDMDLRISLIRM